MAPLNFKKVVSFSSEDPLFPASNLLGKGKWKCKDEGEKQTWVLLQLEETSSITNIDIGNAGAAFIEVQVGRLGTEADQMKVLLVASSFMSVNEARVGENTGRVRMFGLDKLAQEVAKEKWDLVKMVLTQPFSKLARYGMSFLSLSGPGTGPAASPAPALSLGKFRLKAEPEKDIAVGSYFARKKADTSPAAPDKPSVAASLRAEATVSDLTQLKAKKRKREVDLTPAMMEEAKKRKVGPRLVLPSRNTLPGENADEEDEDGSIDIMKKPKDKPKVNDKNVAKDNKKADIVKKNNIPKEKQPAIVESKPKKFASFSDLLKGVVFTISGFQNPLRGEIRKKALEMGAKYCGDWNSSCTHLVCAFANTPKFNQVVGKGIIVKKDWVEECYKQRKRLLWRRFCLDRRDEGREDSEEEVWEYVAGGASSDKVQEAEVDTDEEIENIKLEESKKKEMEENKVVVDRSQPNHMYECDTDEEIDRIKEAEREEEKQKVKRSHPKNIIDPYECDTDEEIEDVKRNSKLENEKLPNDTYECDTDDETTKDIDPYDVDTDIDEEECVKLLPDTSNLSLGALPDYFDSQEFYLQGDFQPGERKLLERYILAFGGRVQPYMGTEVMVVITHSRWGKMFEDARAVSRGVQFVKPRWLFLCKDEGRMVEFGDCKVEK